MEKIIEIPMFVVLWFSLIIDNCIGGSLPQHYIQAPDIYFEKLSWITQDKILLECPYRSFELRYVSAERPTLSISLFPIFGYRMPEPIRGQQKAHLVRLKTLQVGGGGYGGGGGECLLYISISMQH